MAEDQFPVSLQESILAALAFDESYGAAIAAQVNANHFDGLYREVAEAVLAYWREYRRPPGLAHIDDLFAPLLTRNSRTESRMRELLTGLLDLSNGINGKYLSDQAHRFVSSQMVKAGLLEASERYQQGGPAALDDIRQILTQVLHRQEQRLTPGIFLNTAQGFLFLERPPALPLGIPAFDKFNIGPTPGELLLYIGPKNTGKSWFCVHVGRQGLLHRERVVHISLEFDELRIAGRYYQCLFGGGNLAYHNRTELELDELGRLVGWSSTRKKTALNFTTDEGRASLLEKVQAWGLRLGNIVIKQFPTGTLTVSQLEGYLDFLEHQHHFVPTGLIVDYPDLMKIDSRNFRLDIGQQFIQLRGLGVRRNMWVVAPTQGNRETLGARWVDSGKVAEDVSKVFTADNVFTYSQTKGEYRQNLARLTCEYARNAERGRTVVISQSYDTGQYVIDSALQMPDPEAYFARVGDRDRQDEDDGD